MGRYITRILYIDTRTGEIHDKDDMEERNFLETDRKIKIELNNGIYERTIEHYGIVGSACKRDSQLRLL